MEAKIKKGQLNVVSALDELGLTQAILIEAIVKGDTAQVNEALCKVLCHNICVLIQSVFELGIAPTFCGEIEVV